MGQVERVRACNGSQSLALSREKALPVGHPDRRNLGYVTEPIWLRTDGTQSTLTIGQAADVPQQEVTSAGH